MSEHLRQAWGKRVRASEDNDDDLVPQQRAALQRLHGMPRNIGLEDTKKLFAENNIIHHPHDPFHEGFDTGPTHEGTNTFRHDEDLHTGQGHLYKPALEDFIRHGHEDRMDHDYDDEEGHSDIPYHPQTFTHQNKDWIEEGHHRILADRMTWGKDSRIDTYHRDIDSEFHHDSHYADDIDYDKSPE